MATFLEIATPLIQRGIPVIPVAPHDKAGVLTDQFAHATTDLAQIAQWNSENPNFNVGCVGKPDGIVVLDCDVSGLKRRIENETGHRFPSTLTVRSAGKGCDHLYFKQTDVSRELGNQSSRGLFDLQSADKYVVGPGSRLGNGKTYDITDDSPIADFPDWLENWITAFADIPKRPANGNVTLPVHEDFDLDEFLDFFGISGRQSGDWFVTDLCPVAMHKHEQSVRTGFFWDGTSLGWHCFASGCEGSTMSIGQVIKFLNQKKGEPYTGAIWNDPDDDVSDFAEAVDAGVAMPELISEQPNGKPAAFDMIEPAVKGTDLLAFPEECMYGELGVLAKQMHVPHGLAYPALIGSYSIKPDADEMWDTRINVYVCLITQVGGGKNEAIRRSREILRLRKIEEWVPAAPSGARNLMTLIGDKTSGKRNKEIIPGPRKILLLTNEMSDVLKPAGLDNSNLASRLCDLWDENVFILPTRERNITADCRLSWIGGVPATAEKPDRFTSLFNEETSHGLYDRLILGYSAAKFNYRKWSPPSSPEETISAGADYCAAVTKTPHIMAVCPEAQQMYDAWQPIGGGARVKHNGMKVALITAMANHKEEVSAECMKCAIKFMEWQIALRDVFKPGEAMNVGAEFRTVALRALGRRGATLKYINWKRVAHDLKWGDKFGDWVVSAGISSLIAVCELIPEIEIDEKGKEVKSKTMMKLRTDW